MKCTICEAEFAFEARPPNAITCSDTCSRRHARFASKRYYHERGGAEKSAQQKRNARAAVLKPIKAVGEGWDCGALPPCVAKRLGL